jgi:hypothetical protein
MRKKDAPLPPTSETIHFFSKTVELPGASDSVCCCASSSRMESCVQDCVGVIDNGGVGLSGSMRREGDRDREGKESEGMRKYDVIRQEGALRLIDQLRHTTGQGLG